MGATPLVTFHDKFFATVFLQANFIIPNGFKLWLTVYRQIFYINIKIFFIDIKAPKMGGIS